MNIFTSAWVVVFSVSAVSALAAPGADAVRDMLTSSEPESGPLVMFSLNSSRTSASSVAQALSPPAFVRRQGRGQFDQLAKVSSRSRVFPVVSAMIS